MAKEQLNQKEQHYADTRVEAEEIVLKAKENNALTMQKITEKYNKYGQYFLVDLTYSFETPKEIMADRPPQDDVAEGQLPIDEVAATENAQEEPLPFEPDENELPN